MKRLSVVVLLSLSGMILGCKASNPAASAESPTQSASPALAAAPAPVSATPQYIHPQQSGAFQTLTLTDPVMRMKAYDVAIPAGWKFEGVVAQGTACNTTPFPVFRAYSPDGLSEFRREPRLDWASSNNAVARAVAAKCPQLSTSITAADFLRYLAGTMGAQWTAVWPLLPGGAEKFQASIQQVNANYKQYNMPGYHMSGDVAAARTIIHNGSFLIEQQLLVAIICTKAPLPDGTFTISCTANIRAVRAPQGKLDATVGLMDGHTGSGATESTAWTNALSQAAMQRNQRIMQQRAVAFQQWSNIMAQEHSQFMQQFQAEGAARTANFNAQESAKSTAASDWVDYALDQQTVSGSGGAQKVSSGYSTTWSNGQGQTYQTNDAGANPNGVLSGNWTQQQAVHGNGQPLR